MVIWLIGFCVRCNIAPQSLLLFYFPLSTWHLILGTFHSALPAFHSSFLIPRLSFLNPHFPLGTSHFPLFRFFAFRFPLPASRYLTAHCKIQSSQISNSPLRRFLTKSLVGSTSSFNCMASIISPAKAYNCNNWASRLLIPRWRI